MNDADATGALRVSTDRLTERIDRGEFDALLRHEVGPEDIDPGRRQFFLLAAEVARQQFDPSTEWVAFVQALWAQLEAGFGWEQP